MAENIVIKSYSALKERSFRSLHEVLSTSTSGEVLPLYYLLQVLQALWFLNQRGVFYHSLDPKNIQVFNDSSVKLHDI
jgi:hypothetical protein